MTCSYERLYRDKLEEISDIRKLLELKDKELIETKTKLVIAMTPKGSDVGDWSVDQAYERKDS